MHPKNDKKTINAWAMFDWANSAYALVISTAIFPPFFQSMTDDIILIWGMELTNTALYSFAVSLSFFILTIMNPILGGLADYGGRRKYFMKIFTSIGAFSCICMFFFKSSDFVWWATSSFIFSTIGFTASTVFYNAYLPDIVTEDKMDMVSAKGYSYGYIGSVILLLFILWMIMSPNTFGMEASSLQARIGFILVGVWWFVFAQYSFKHLPLDQNIKNLTNPIRKGLKEMWATFQKIRSSKQIKLFLSSFFFYIAGVNTIIYVATLFAQTILGFEQNELIITVLILQIVGIGGAYLFAYIANKKGNKTSLITMIIIWAFVCIAGYFVHDVSIFYALAGMVGLVMGGIQSMSRSSFSKMIDEDAENANSYFGIYDALKNLAIVAGTFVYGLVDTLTQNMRFSMLSIGAFFIVALIIMLKVDFSEFQSKTKLYTA